MKFSFFLISLSLTFQNGLVSCANENTIDNVSSPNNKELSHPPDLELLEQESDEPITIFPAADNANDQERADTELIEQQSDVSPEDNAEPEPQPPLNVPVRERDIIATPEPTEEEPIVEEIPSPKEVPEIIPEETSPNKNPEIISPKVKEASEDDVQHEVLSKEIPDVPEELPPNEVPEEVPQNVEIQPNEVEPVPKTPKIPAIPKLPKEPKYPKEPAMPKPPKAYKDPYMPKPPKLPKPPKQDRPIKVNSPWEVNDDDPSNVIEPTYKVKYVYRKNQPKQTKVETEDGLEPSQTTVKPPKQPRSQHVPNRKKNGDEEESAESEDLEEVGDKKIIMRPANTVTAAIGAKPTGEETPSSSSRIRISLSSLFGIVLLLSFLTF